ncbi:hypothetical protein GLOIN_2v1871739 [Rhizophagus irregularis DAOM 181602=DAOM 197198]|nr:hypothetical protein GLOIN_2v1871739 [Rhizophagus irregularis DAOM 181602=DAOM 197198]
MEEYTLVAVVPKAKQQIFYLVKRRRVKESIFRDVTNDLVINNGSIRNNEEIKDGELIFAELDTYLDEAKKNSYRTTPSKKLALGQLSS